MNAIALPARQLSPEWHELRRRGFGASEAAAAAGVDPYTTPEELVAEKIGLLPPAPENELMRRGRQIEPLIADIYSEETGHRLRRVNRLLQHPKYQFVLASLDRERVGEKRLVEIKQRRHTADWGEPGTDEIPEPVLYQVQQQMLVTGYPVADVVVLVAGTDLLTYQVEADREFHELLVDVEADLFEYVRRGELPPETERPARKRQVFAGDLVADEEITAMVLRLAELKSRIAVDEAERKEIERNVIAAAVNRKRVLGDDFKLTIVDGRDGERVAWQKVAEGYRELALQLWGALELLPGERPYPIALSDKRPLESLYTTTSEVAPSVRTYGALFERKEASEQ